MELFQGVRLPVGKLYFIGDGTSPCYLGTGTMLIPHPSSISRVYVTLPARIRNWFQGSATFSTMSIALPSTLREGAVAFRQAATASFRCLYSGLSLPLVVSSQAGSGSAKPWAGYFILLPQTQSRYYFLYVFCSEKFLESTT